MQRSVHSMKQSRSLSLGGVLLLCLAFFLSAGPLTRKAVEAVGPQTGSPNIATLQPKTPKLALEPAAVLQSVQTANGLDASVRTSGRSFAELLKEAQTNGAVRVIVGLRLAFQPEGRLSQFARQSQRQTIATRQIALLNRLTAYRVNAVKRFDSIPFLALEVDAAALLELQNAPEIASLVEDDLQQFSLAESVPLIGASAAWASGYAGGGQVVAIVDTGVAKTHPFLADKVVSEACYSTTNSTTTSVCPGGAAASTAADAGVNCEAAGCEHGTHVAGIAAGKGDSFSGVARDAKLISIKVASKLRTCPASPNACVASYVSDTLLGLQRVYELRNEFAIAAVNLSLGGGAPALNCDAPETAYKAVIDNLRSVGIATVVAAGNEGNQNGLSRPACISTALSVGSSGDGSSGSTANAVSSFSNSAASLNLLAPGEWINSAVPNGNFANFRGTSMAAPHVAGAVALLKSKTPNASVAQIHQALAGTGLLVTDTRNGLSKPRIRVDNAVNALSGTPCHYAIAPGNQTFNAGGGTGMINVTAGSGCAWTAASNAPWLSITAGATGSANGAVNFTVAANAGLSRASTLTIAGNTFVVTQTGVPALALDDGSFEGFIGINGGGTITALNRLTPTSYPAAINAVAVYFQSLRGVAKGASVTILYGVNPSGNADVNGVALQTMSSTVQALDAFNVYAIPPLVITSGDFVIGFRLTHSGTQLPVVLDLTPSSQRRSYVSSGGAFTLIDSVSSQLAGNFGIRALLAPKAAIAAGATIATESCATSNQTLDPGETVTVSLALRNAGTQSLANLVATLQSSGGVTQPSGPQSYEALTSGGPPVTRPFTFTVNPALACGGVLTATLQLQDGATDLGIARFTFPVGLATTGNYSYSGATVPIPDPGTVEIPLAVSDLGSIRDVNVRLRLNHTFASDLDIFLVGPDGTTVELSTDNGSSGDNYGSGANSCTGTFTIFDDAASAPITAASAPFTGTFRPEGSLAAFNGKPMNGSWRLRITDDDSVATGTLGCWQLEITRQQAACCGSTCPFISAASATSGTIGSNLVLTGVNFTGVTGVRFANNVTASFTLNSATQLTTSVPAGAVTGPITLSKNGCPDTQLNFRVTSSTLLQDILPEQPVTQSLTIDDQVRTSNGGRHFFDAYRLNITVANTTLAIDLRSSQFDAAVFLYRINNGNLTQIATDDQSGGYGNGITENNNALLLTLLTTPGEYALFATSSDEQPNGLGSYTLLLKTNVMQSLSYGDNLNNPNITTTDLQTSAGTYLDAYWFNAVANDNIDVRMGSTAFDSFLILQGNEGGIPIASDDNSGGSSNARLMRRLGAGGIYIIIATPYERNRTGNYTLSLGGTSNCPAISLVPASLPTGTRNAAYNQTFTANGGTAPYAFSLSAGTLPGGLTLSSSGVLSGTPTQSGSFNFTVRATAANGCMGTHTYTLMINNNCPTITLTPVGLPNGSVGTAYSQTITATPSGSYTFTVTAGTLPAGLSLNSTTGAITGTPTATGTANFTITALSVGPCSGGRAYVLTIVQPNPAPMLTSLEPNARVAGSAGFPLALSGSGFIPASQVKWNGADRLTHFVSSTRLLIDVPASDIATAGSVMLTVTNPAPGGGMSNALTFTITPPSPAPALTNLMPNAAAVGSAPFPLTVMGTNFSNNSVVRWNNADRATTVVNATQLRADILATDLANADTANVTVFTPGPGGGVTDALPFTIAPRVASVSAASFQATELAPDSMIAAFGVNLATGAAAATSLPLPTALLGTTVEVKDSAGVTRQAVLFFVSPAQINYLLPPGLAQGMALVTIRNGANQLSLGTLQVAAIAPGLFTANASGQGVPAGVALRVRADGAQSLEAIAQFEAAQNRFVAIPIDVSDANEQVFLILFGTGFRSVSQLADVTVRIGGQNAEVTFAGAQGSLAGLDQLNVRLASALAGRGEVDVALTVSGRNANVVRVNVK